MKAIKLITKHTEAQIRTLFGNTNLLEVEELGKVYKKFEFAQFINKEGNVCMFAFIHENYIPDLINLYIKLSLKFTYEDVTKDVLYGSINTSEYVSEALDPLIREFIESNLDMNTVLDKIGEMGIGSLTDVDKLILEKV